MCEQIATRALPASTIPAARNPSGMAGYPISEATGLEIPFSTFVSLTF
jgi:hypothetical protein